MEILKGLFETRGLSLRDPALKALYEGWGEGSSIAGPIVNEQNALKISVVYACVRIISQAIAMLPLHLYLKTDSGREKADTHPLYFILHKRPNPYMTSFELRELLQSWLLLWGNAFCEIERNGGGQVVGL